MGEVRRVYDRHLGREVVRKVLLWDHVEDEGLRRRFIEETRITASLQHPGIPPIHDFGIGEDGRPWMTMREVRGRTLTAVLAAPMRDLTTLRRHVTWFVRACEAVTYAHAMGVVHRDLKPDNILLGEFGEVQVIDWGAARRAGPLVRDGAPRAPGLTLTGEIIGTPGYMAPEQAAGGEIGPAADVFALGVVLSQILQQGGEATDVPTALEEIVIACAAASPEDRPDAGTLVERIDAWLDGTRRAEQADALVAAARALEPEILVLRRTAFDRAHEAEQLLDRTPAHPAVSAEKRRAWALGDAAAASEREAAEQAARMVSHLEAALALVDEHRDAHALLARHYRRDVERAEDTRNAPLAALAERRLRQHDRGTHRDWLAGDGAVTLATVESAEVLLCAYELRDRQLVPVVERSLGMTPLREVRVPRGSRLLLLRRPGRPDVRFPIVLRRLEHWAGPDGNDPLWLPGPADLGSLDRYVPAGWFRAGGDPGAGDAVSGRRVWLDGFVGSAHPVTTREYLAFLEDQLRAGGDIGELVPRQTRSGAGEGEAPAVFVEREGRLVAEDSGPGWGPDSPVVQITWHAARSYAAWLAARTGLPWRLPHALEREKMARGADGRRWPWGDHEDASWFCNLRAHVGPPARANVGTFPIDVSVYGVEGLAGNVRDWCANAWERWPDWTDGRRVDVARAPAPGPLCEVRGGAWSSEPQFCRPAARFANAPTTRFGSGGFRLVRGLPP